MNKDKNNIEELEVSYNGNSNDDRVFDENIELKVNAMLKKKPELFYEWSFEKNDKLGLDVYKVTYGSGKIAWWNCPKCREEYDMSIRQRAGRLNQNCPYCRGCRVGSSNSLATLYPNISSQWNRTLNGDLTPHDVTRGSSEMVWWNCLDCKSEYISSVYNKVNGRGCSYCRGLKANYTNSLTVLNPVLASQWHPTKNDDLTPHDVTRGHNGIVWWLGECGHEWDATVNSRINMESGCPYCTNQKVLIGFNDMWTTNPELASQLLNPEDGYKYMQNSGKKVDWKCSDCGNIIKNKTIEKFCGRRASCPRCSDNTPYPEKFMYNVLKEAEIEFDYDNEKAWSRGKRYDFYFELDGIKYIIETHGIQHYEEGFKALGGRSLKEEQENDKLKEQLAKENGIGKYIVIDCRYSTLEWIRNSIENSELINIIKDIDFVKIEKLSNKNLIKDICDLWNLGVKSAPEISEITKIGRNTITRYLKKGAEIGWCDYSPNTQVPIIQLSKNLEYIREWSSMSEAVEMLELSHGNLTSVCQGKRKTTGGFKWMYKKDYDKKIS